MLPGFFMAALVSMFLRGNQCLVMCHCLSYAFPRGSVGMRHVIYVINDITPNKLVLG